MPAGFDCSLCGQHHPELPMSFGADAPAHYQQVAESESAARCDLTSEICIIDKRHFFVRACLEIPVLDGPRSFVWSVWASLSEASFRRMAALWDTAGRESEPPFFGWLCTAVPLYPVTLLLKSHVHMQPVGERPLVELEPTDHPLALEQRNGITMHRVQEIAEQLLHST